MFATFQKLLPKHLLSRLIGYVAATEIAWIKSTFINVFSYFYNIDLSEAERSSPQDYRSFNDFFTRSLKPGTRTISGIYCSPADGTIAALGDIHGDTLIQSKNHDYSLSTLLGVDDASEFQGGSFITVYLAPHNYHRVHVTCDGELHNAKYIPGDLFSVNASTALNLPNLFARNERLVCTFRTDKGPMATVMVGAMIVAGIQPVWLDKAYKPQVQIHTEMKRAMRQGDELGQFQLGSTAILVFPERVNFLVKQGETVHYGQAIS
jgi:phosphatidylserine decarboxylase